jgi:methionyl aminopeptidase
MIVLRSEREIRTIGECCRIVALVLSSVERWLRPGVTSGELEERIEALIERENGKAAFRGWHGFPGAVCISFNEEVVHGIPSDRTIADGDVVSIDVGVKKDGYFGDGARTFAVGSVSPEVLRLLAVTEAALMDGIGQARVGNRLSDISHAVQRCVERAGFSVVEKLTGHGIGTELWEDPPIPNFGPPGRGPKLKAGMVLAIEPMVNAGGPEVETLPDGWTCVTRDGSHSAHFEHTVVITENGPRVLTADKRGT